MIKININFEILIRPALISVSFKDGFAYSRLGSFWVISGSSVPTLPERPKQLKRPDTTGDFHMVVCSLLRVVWNAVVKTGTGADNTTLAGNSHKNGGCSRVPGRFASIFTFACHSPSQKETTRDNNNNVYLFLRKSQGKGRPANSIANLGG